MGFKLLYEQKNGTAKILRCFGEAEEISLPAFVHGCPVTEIGDYIFSAGMRTEPFGYLWEEGCQKLPVRKTGRLRAWSGLLRGQGSGDFPAA